LRQINSTTQIRTGQDKSNKYQISNEKLGKIIEKIIKDCVKINQRLMGMVVLISKIE
jgi:hypothetical protein